MSDSQLPTNEQPTVEELTEIIQEFEQYRERLVNEALATAKRAKLMKSAVMSQIEPELTQIDAALNNLRSQYAALTGNN